MEHLQQHFNDRACPGRCMDYSAVESNCCSFCMAQVYMIASKIQIFKKTIFFNQVDHEKKRNRKMIIKMASAQENINSISWDSFCGGNIIVPSQSMAESSGTRKIGDLYSSILSDFNKIFSQLTELLPSQSNLSSCSSGCRVSFESNRLLISLSNDSLFSQIFKIATEETPPTAKNNTPGKN